MAEGNGDVSIKEETDIERTNDYHKLIEYGLDAKVAAKLDEIYQTGKLAHVDLDDRALDALKEFPVEGALTVLTQFLESNLEHVSNKSAYLCGVMKTYRQKSRAGTGGAVTGGTIIKAPDEEKIKAILERTGYALDVTTGQRKYGGPPPNWEGPTPGSGCEVFCGKIPKDMYEDELIPLFEKCGSIWDLRLMMDPMTGQNRGYAFVTFTTKDAAQNAVRELDNHEMKPGKPLKVNISVPNLRLFVGNIPKSKGKDEIMEEFSKLADKWELRYDDVRRVRCERAKKDTELTWKDGKNEQKCPGEKNRGSCDKNREKQYDKKKNDAKTGGGMDKELNDTEMRKGNKIGVTLSFNNHRLFVGNIPKNRDRADLYEEFVKHSPGLNEVIIYSSPDDKKKNRGFCFLEYESHKAASLAKRRLGTGRVKVWGCDIIVDWADPQEEPDAETMSKVKVLYVRNLTQDCSEEKLKESFEMYGKIDRVKKIKDYAFIHFEDRENAVRALKELNGKDLAGACIEVSLAKPPSDKKKKEEVLRARERRMMQMMQGRGGSSPNHPGMLGGPLVPLRPGAGPRGAAGTVRGAAMGRGDYDYDYDYYGYGDYRGGYSDPYYDDYYRFDDYYYDFTPPPPPARGTRSRQALLEPRDAEKSTPYLPRTENDFDQGGLGPTAGRGRPGGPPPRGLVRAARPAASGAHGVARAPVLRGPQRVKANLTGKRKLDGSHHTPGGIKRRYKRQTNWGSQPLIPQPLGSYVNGGGYDQDFYQDTYSSWS